MAGYEWENEWLKEELKEKEEKLQHLDNRLEVLNKIMEGLKAQRNELQEQYKLKENENIELQKTCQDVKEERKELQQKYKIFEKKQKEADTANIALKIQLLEQVNQYQQQLLECQQQLLKRDDDLLDLKDQMIQVNRDLNEKILEVEHVKIDRDALAEENRLMYIRSALDIFGKTKVHIKDNRTRGEEWEEYFKTSEEAKKALAEENFESDYVKNTVISLYGKLNKKVHGCHKPESTIPFQKNDFDDDESALLKVVWRLSPLKKHLHVEV